MPSGRPMVERIVSFCIVSKPPQKVEYPHKYSAARFDLSRYVPKCPVMLTSEVSNPGHFRTSNADIPVYLYRAHVYRDVYVDIS